MAIRPNQRRVTIIMDNDDYEMVARAAKADRRSVSSYCNNVIMESIDDRMMSCTQSTRSGTMAERRTYRMMKNPSRFG